MRATAESEGAPRNARRSQMRRQVQDSRWIPPQCTTRNSTVPEKQKNTVRILSMATTMLHNAHSGRLSFAGWYRPGAVQNMKGTRVQPPRRPQQELQEPQQGTARQPTEYPSNARKVQQKMKTSTERGKRGGGGERPKSPQRPPHDTPERRADGRGTYQLAHWRSAHPPRRQPAAAAASRRQGSIATTKTSRTDANEARHGRLHTDRDASPRTSTEEKKKKRRKPATVQAKGTNESTWARHESQLQVGSGAAASDGDASRRAADGGDGDTGRRPRAADRKRGSAPHEAIKRSRLVHWPAPAVYTDPLWPHCLIGSEGSAMDHESRSTCILPDQKRVNYIPCYRLPVWQLRIRPA